MPFTHHSTLMGIDIHSPHAFIYPSEEERLGATGLAQEDIGKVAKQEDNGSHWILDGVDPITWLPFGRSISGVNFQGIHSNVALNDEVVTTHNDDPSRRRIIQVLELVGDEYVARNPGDYAHNCSISGQTTTKKIGGATQNIKINVITL